MAWNQTGLPWGARLWGMGQDVPNQPGSLYSAEEPAIRRTFKEARQRFGSALAALSPGNVRARQEGEAGMATQESKILTALQQRSKQQEFENLMRLLSLYG